MADALGLEFYIGPPREDERSISQAISRLHEANAIEDTLQRGLAPTVSKLDEVLARLQDAPKALREEMALRAAATEAALKELTSQLSQTVPKKLEDDTALAETGSGNVVEFPDAREAEAHEQDPTALRSHGFRPLRRRGAKLAAGYGAFIESEPVIGHLAFREDWLLKHGVNHEKADIVEVMGNSMEPTLPDGSLILVDYQRTRRLADRVFAVRSDDLLLIKRLVHDNHDWLLVSDNDKEYKPVPWPREAVVIGQVMWTGRTL